MTHLQRAYIFDIDGVLADCSHRLHFIQQEPKDWKRFYENLDKDEVIQPNKNTLRLLRNALHGYQTRGILFVTGRSEAYRELTMNWLKKKFGDALETFTTICCSCVKTEIFAPTGKLRRKSMRTRSNVNMKFWEFLKTAHGLFKCGGRLD